MLGGKERTRAERETKSRSRASRRRRIARSAGEAGRELSAPSPPMGIHHTHTAARRRTREEDRAIRMARIRGRWRVHGKAACRESAHIHAHEVRGSGRGDRARVRDEAKFKRIRGGRASAVQKHVCVCKGAPHAREMTIALAGCVGAVSPVTSPGEYSIARAPKARPRRLAYNAVHSRSSIDNSEPGQTPRRRHRRR